MFFELQVASGLPVRNGNKHVHEIACMALELIHGIAKFPVPSRPSEHLQVRVGINSGGSSKFLLASEVSVPTETFLVLEQQTAEMKKNQREGCTYLLT